LILARTGASIKFEDVFEGALRDLETGTGFAGAKLSEMLPAARVARFVSMTPCGGEHSA
jgi:hypothetical protein